MMPLNLGQNILEGRFLLLIADCILIGQIVRDHIQTLLEGVQETMALIMELFITNLLLAYFNESCNYAAPLYFKRDDQTLPISLTAFSSDLS